MSFIHAFIKPMKARMSFIHAFIKPMKARMSLIHAFIKPRGTRMSFIRALINPNGPAHVSRSRQHHAEDHVTVAPSRLDQADRPRLQSRRAAASAGGSPRDGSSPGFVSCRFVVEGQPFSLTRCGSFQTRLPW